MAQIQVTVRNQLYKNRKAYAYPMREFNTYVGEIVPNPKWVEDDCICLSTGNRSFAFRVLEKSMIIDSTAFIPYTPPKVDKEVFQCRGSKGEMYKITREGSRWSCTCAGFGFRRDCKHIQASKNALNKENTNA